MPSLKDMPIALIGGAGFIGHNLALSLKAQGANVTIIDSLAVNNLLAFASDSEPSPNRALYTHILNERISRLREAGVPLLVQDARDYGAISKLLTTINPEVVVQLAAVSHAGKSNKDPYSTFDHSLRTLENTLDWARSRAKHFVYFSSSMVYGNFPDGAVTEDTPCNPLGIYGALKFAGEKLVIAYNQVFDLPYTIIRPSALYGERCVSRRVGQIFIENALQGVDVVVQGEGEERLDFTYIGDLVAGIECVLTHDGAKNQTFNLTYGESRSLAQMVEILVDHFPDVKVKYSPRDVLMPKRGTLSVERAKKLIGYKPQFPLEKGFPRYIEWYRQLQQAAGIGTAAATTK